LEKEKFSNARKKSLRPNDEDDIEIIVERGARRKDHDSKKIEIPLRGFIITSYLIWN
jgi:hypothetical protein